MDQATHNKIVSFIWGIADDVLRDLFRRGKYPDVILPMCVLRRMDAVLEPTKQAVLDTKQMLDNARITEQRAALADAAGQAFYNTSRFTLRDLKSRGNHQQLLADFEDYLNGFSPNVQDILENFKFRNQLPTLAKADALGTLINKFLDPDIDLSPAGIDNHSMGTVFEELVRKFNEDNNEEAGEHWTPRDAVRLMANLVFLPVEDQIKSGTYLLFDDACGTGGMLTVAEETLTAIGKKRGLQVEARLYGQEINPETYAICKADMLIKGEGENADHIVGGAEWSTLSHDAFPGQEFDFMVANPPYGKSWKKDLEAMGGKDGMRDLHAQATAQDSIEFTDWMARQVRALRKLGFQVADKDAARVLVELHNQGLFAGGLVVVGTLAFMAWLNDLGARAVTSRTQDIDLARRQPLKLAAPQSFLATVQATSLKFSPIPTLSLQTPSTSVKLPGAAGLRVDLLAHGPAIGQIISVPELNWHAQAIPHFDYVLDDPRPAALLAGGHCIPVNLPAPERFVWHKLYSSTARVASRDKASKDLLQAATLAAVLVEHDDAHLDEALADAPAEVRAAAQARLPALRELLDRHPHTLAAMEAALAA